MFPWTTTIELIERPLNAGPLYAGIVGLFTPHDAIDAAATLVFAAR